MISRRHILLFASLVILTRSTSAQRPIARPQDKAIVIDIPPFPNDSSIAARLPRGMVVPKVYGKDALDITRSPKFAPALSIRMSDALREVQQGATNLGLAATPDLTKLVARAPLFVGAIAFDKARTYEGGDVGQVLEMADEFMVPFVVDDTVRVVAIIRNAGDRPDPDLPMAASEYTDAYSKALNEILINPSTRDLRLHFIQLKELGLDFFGYYGNDGKLQFVPATTVTVDYFKSRKLIPAEDALRQLANEIDQFARLESDAPSGRGAVNRNARRNRRGPGARH